MSKGEKTMEGSIDQVLLHEALKYFIFNWDLIPPPPPSYTYSSLHDYPQYYLMPSFLEFNY